MKTALQELLERYNATSFSKRHGIAGLTLHRWKHGNPPKKQFVVEKLRKALAEEKALIEKAIKEAEK